MTLFNKDLQTKAAQTKWLKSDDFYGKEWVIQDQEIVDSQYGAMEDSPLVEKGILEEGQTFRYHLMSVDGEEKLFDSASAGLFYALIKAGVDKENTIKVSRTGKGRETRYEIAKQ